MDMIDNLMAISAHLDGCSVLIKMLSDETGASFHIQNAICGIAALLDAISQELENAIDYMETQP